VETRLIRTLVGVGALVVCAGGEGVPVVHDQHTGRLRGVEAVVDKNLTAALLAEALAADAQPRLPAASVREQADRLPVLLVVLSSGKAVERGHSR